MSFSDLGDSDRQRLGAAFFNIKDQKSAMSKDNVRFPLEPLSSMPCTVDDQHILLGRLGERRKGLQTHWPSDLRRIFQNQHLPHEERLEQAFTHRQTPPRSELLPHERRLPQGYQYERTYPPPRGTFCCSKVVLLAHVTDHDHISRLTGPKPRKTSRQTGRSAPRHSR